MKNVEPQSHLYVVKIFLLAYRSDLERGKISKIYRVLQEMEDEDTTNTKEKWEKESNINIQMETWGTTACPGKILDGKS